MRPDEKIMDKLNQSKAKAFKRSNIMQPPRMPPVSNRILTVHIFYIANYQQKTVPELVSLLLICRALKYRSRVL